MMEWSIASNAAERSRSVRNDFFFFRSQYFTSSVKKKKRKEKS